MEKNHNKRNLYLKPQKKIFNSLNVEKKQGIASNHKINKFSRNYETSNKRNDVKELNYLLKSYKDFVRKNFKNLDLNEEIKKNNKKQEIISEQIPEIKSNIISNILLKTKETNSDFNNFLDSISPDFLDENITCELPNIPELYIEKRQLGFERNNQNDYLRRKAELIKDNEIIISEDLELDKPITEPNIEMNNDKNINNIQAGLNIDELTRNIPTRDDQIVIQNKIKAMNNIVEICQPKLRKEIIFIGYDQDNKKDILRIFGKKFDKEGKMKVIEYNSFNIKFNFGVSIEKTVKELFGLDSISKAEIKDKINEIINKFKIDIIN